MKSQSSQLSLDEDIDETQKLLAVVTRPVVRDRLLQLLHGLQQVRNDARSVGTFQVSLIEHTLTRVPGSHHYQAASRHTFCNCFYCFGPSFSSWLFTNQQSCQDSLSKLFHCQLRAISRVRSCSVLLLA